MANGYSKIVFWLSNTGLSILKKSIVLWNIWYCPASSIDFIAELSEVQTINGISTCSFGAIAIGTPCMYRLFSPSDSPWSEIKITQLRCEVRDFMLSITSFIR